jgi:DNA-binding NarL/FixJ family response regulator
VEESDKDEAAPRAIVMVIDPQVLRRAALMSFLGPWAAAQGVTLREASPADLPPRSDQATPAVLMILNLGGLPPRDPRSLAWLQQLTQVQPGAPLAVLSDLEAAEEVVAALRSGARGYLPTSTDPEIARHALTFIMRGGSYFPPGAMLERGPNSGIRLAQGGGAMARRDGGARHRPAGDAAPEDAILAHLRDGLSNKLIGRLLGLPESTVKVHVRRILRRYGAANRTQAALAAFGAAERPWPADPLPGVEAMPPRPERWPPPQIFPVRLKGVA